MRCPNCGSTNISSIVDTKTRTKGFDGGDACCGYLLFGWPGILCVMIVEEDFNEKKYKNKNVGIFHEIRKPMWLSSTRRQKF